MAGGRREGGGILGLLDLIEEHRTAIEYDWRTRFRLGLDAVPDEMGWGEAIRQVRFLQSDPSSAIAAAAAGWEYPISREALLIADLYDLTVAAHSDSKKGRPKPHPGRPFKQDASEKKKHGDAAGRSPAEVVALLRPPI